MDTARNVVLFLFAVTGSLAILVGLALLVRITRLLLLAGDETRGVLHSLHASLATIDITTSFLSRIAITPLSRIAGVILGARAVAAAAARRRRSEIL